MILKTAALPHEIAAIEKLAPIKIGALYMEMGTGKTRTALGLIKLRMDAGKISHVIWLCPCSVKANLLLDIQKHSDLADGPLTICGIETLSTSVRENIRLLEIVESYPTYLIVDESNLVKNPSALRSKHITGIAEKCKYKLILNGTPVTKCAADLFAQWYILDWRVLGYRSFWSFAANHLEYDEKYHQIKRVLNVDYLVRKIAPYSFQIKKSECFNLPPKVYCTQMFFMTEEQDDNYNYVVEHLLTSLDEMRPESIYRLFGALQSVTSGFALRINNNLDIEKYPMFINPNDNPRIKALLKSIKQSNDKAIIFCNYVQEIKDICSVINANGRLLAIPFYGEVPQKKRQETINKFMQDFRFLVANKSCGAYGLNLQFCHRIIYYSNDWDWGTRSQSEDRVHRFGQTHEVDITDIVAQNSIDERIIQCLNKKENLVGQFKSELHSAGLKKHLYDFVRGEKYGKDIPKL